MSKDKMISEILGEIMKMLRNMWWKEEEKYDMITIHYDSAERVVLNA